MMNLTKPQAHRAMGVFLCVWFGQLISLLGSGLTGFSLGLWVLRRTGSVTEFGLISVCTVLPGVLFSPVAGALVDRWDRRITMMVSELGAGVATLALAGLLTAGWLQVWHVYVAMSIISTLAAFQWPAFTAATSLLAPKEQLANAGGLVQMAHGVAKTAAPVLASIMIAANTIGILGVLLADSATYAFALLTLALVRFPALQPKEDAVEAPSLADEIRAGWAYLWARPGLVGLLLFLAATNFAMGMIMVLVTPLLLSFSSTEVLGTVMSTAGVGMFVGSVLISIWGGPRRRMNAVLGFLLLCGLSLIPAGFPPSALLIGAGAFVFLLGIPVINGCSEAILQCKVAPNMQGRVFATTNMVVSSSLPLAFVLAGPLADRVFEPLLSKGGAWAVSVGSIIGTGPGRGIALMFMVLGLSIVILTIAGWCYAPLSRVEELLPDEIDAPTAPQALSQEVVLAELAAH